MKRHPLRRALDRPLRALVALMVLVVIFAMVFIGTRTLGRNAETIARQQSEIRLQRAFLADLQAEIALALQDIKGIAQQIDNNAALRHDAGHPKAPTIVTQPISSPPRTTTTRPRPRPTTTTRPSQPPPQPPPPTTTTTHTRTATLHDHPGWLRP